VSIHKLRLNFVQWSNVCLPYTDTADQNLSGHAPDPNPVHKGRLYWFLVSQSRKCPLIYHYSPLFMRNLHSLIGGLIGGGISALGGLFGKKGKREFDGEFNQLSAREEMELDTREPEPYVPSDSRSKY
jgi:hypothetical protein